MCLCRTKELPDILDLGLQAVLGSLFLGNVEGCHVGWMTIDEGKNLTAHEK